jgi:hypothetical protein
MSDITETIIVVLVVVQVRVELVVVDPDVAGGLDTNSITVLGEHQADLQVADDNVGDFVDVETNTDEGGLGVESKDGGVAARINLGGTGDLSRHVDDLGRVIVSDNGGGEFGER